jgi:hypothetical protein
VNERASAGDNAEEAKGRVTDEKMEEDLQKSISALSARANVIFWVIWACVYKERKFESN